MSGHEPLYAALSGLVEDGAAPEGTLAASFDQILKGDADPALIAAVLTALRIRGVTGTDLADAAQVLRSHARTICAPDDVVDTCGTGGVGWPSLNTSTAAAIVAAAAGARIAKHGNRSTPPKTGSADVLEALGVTLDPDQTTLETCLDRAGIAFLFAPAHHAAMRHVMPVRRTLRIGTVFNMLGPLANPARARRHVLGVPKPHWQMPMAQALSRLGTVHAMVVHGTSDGFDEISVSGPTRILQVLHGDISEHTVTPSDLGVAVHPVEALRGSTPPANADALLTVLDGRASAFADAVTVNAGAALLVAGLAEDIADGGVQARAAIASGKATETLKMLIACSAGRAVP